MVTFRGPVTALPSRKNADRTAVEEKIIIKSGDSTDVPALVTDGNII